MLGAQLLALLGIADNEIVRTLGAIRTDQYRSLRRYFHARDDAAKNHNGYTEERRSLISVNQDTTLREFCAAISGIEVTGIIRAGVRTDAPPPNATIRPGDVLEVCGEVDVLNLARKHLSS